MSIEAWTYLFVGLTFGLYLTIAWLSRVKDTTGFYVAGRGVPAIANGMATGADWMSAASFISMAGLISTMGYAGGVYLMGWTGGYVLLALLLAPYLRKFGHFTVPDFVGDRYASRSSSHSTPQTLWSRLASNPARLVAVLCAIFVSFTYVCGQMRGVGLVFAGFLNINVEAGVVVGMIIVFIYATLGGMKGITWTQVAQYWVLITAFLIPAIAVSIKLTGQPLPQIGMGSTLTGSVSGAGEHLLDRLNALNQELGFASYTEPFIGEPWNKLNVFCTALALMVGTAGLPHIIVRFYTVKSVKDARWSAFWALFFIALLYLTAPAIAAFARYYMIESLQGKTASELPDWFNRWSSSGVILWLDDGDGRVRYSNGPDNEIFRTASGGLELDGRNHSVADIRVQQQQWISTAGAEGRDWRPIMRAKGLSGPDKDIIVLAAPGMAGLPGWIVAFVAAGGLAAALSTASGLLLVISSSVAHDLYYRVVDPRASEGKRLLVGRTVIGLAVVVAGLFGIFPPAFVGEVVAFAFGLAAASFFPAIMLGIFTKRVGTVPAVTGMIVGIGFTAFYIFCAKAHTILGPALADSIFGEGHFLRTPWCLGIDPQGIGVVGMVLNFVVTLALTPFFSAPDKQIQDMVLRLREPEGAGPAVEIETAIAH
ncbi:MAG TPA: sodium:solute symporter family protein [Phycisphaeraceae bacterium]